MTFLSSVISFLSIQLCAGWGNLGAGVTQLIVGSFLFPFFKFCFQNTEDPSEYAWRYVSIVPAVVAFITGVGMYFITDDFPKGNVHELEAHRVKPEKQALSACQSATFNLNTWLLAIQYAACFGVELTMNSAASLYFKDQFGVSTETAAAMASIFGWMNLFARGVGGFLSDRAALSWGMRGRLYTQFILLAGEGALVLIFGNTHSLAGAIMTLVCFSLFVQAAEGSTYGVVPYVDQHFTGSVTGIVGAGGNVGAVVFSIMFREMNYVDAFTYMGIAVMCSSLLTGVIFIRGESAMFGNIKTVFSKAEDDYEEEVKGLKDAKE